ncbi:sporulation protein YpjB [Siminovitchia sp. FSL H7-0308]|uniref:Sporulation protein YpjB n=1 Tax=Siminovitchia thermophila TaxID=1245522 RepID=A0ABS2R1V4_9BACI|nr:sporulation protein YpjB [Siminovitchia thermophila]MBM7713620.1 sporulation protein YpjB [Siminovitchia thermophila]ONK21913.1 sporulation protein YpjB [Bacillus sp. VT-16-64]
MKLLSGILLSLTLFLNGGLANSKPDPVIEELDQLADEALQLTKFSRFDEAKVLLERYAVQFSKQGMKEQTFTMDELRVLTAAHHEALRAVTSVDMDKEERIRMVTAFRLANDAVQSNHQPMWLEMEGSIMDSFRQVKNAALDGDQESYNRHLNDFLSIYSVIQPSLKIDLPAEKLQKIDSRIAFFDNYRSQFTEQNWTSQLEDFEADLKRLFAEVDEDEADPSLWWVISMTGSVIILTLSYVSWRKYKGEKKERKRKDPNN